MKFEGGTHKQAQDDVAKFAIDAFKTHVITQLGPDEFRCGRPGSSTYCFHLIFRPGTIIFYGDIGNWILRPYSERGIGWLKDSVKSPQYVLESCEKHTCFYVGDAIARIQEDIDRFNETEGEDYNVEQRDKYIEARDEIQRLHSFGELGPQNYYDLMTEAGYESDCMCSDKPTARMYWMIEAFRWFCANHKE